MTQVIGAYADIHTWDNLYAAYRLAARGKRSRPAAAAFEYRLEDNLVRLQDELAAETYRPGPYASFLIHEPKQRLISAAPFRDRVVHHALCQVIEPAFETSFIHHSYANRVGKGTHRCLAQCQAWARRYAYVLQCDVVQFLYLLSLCHCERVDEPPSGTTDHSEAISCTRAGRLLCRCSLMSWLARG